MGGEDGCDEFGHLFCVPDKDDVKQKNNNHETIPSRFSLNRKQRGLLLYVICVLSTRSFEWNLESIDIWTNCQFIWSGKAVHLTVSLGISKTIPLATMSQQAHAC